MYGYLVDKISEYRITDFIHKRHDTKLLQFQSVEVSCRGVDIDVTA